MTREEARMSFLEAGLTYDLLSVDVLQDLRERVDLKMQETGFMRGAGRMRRDCTLEQSPQGVHASLRCRSDYFDDREAVTFNPGGFIGFAGWADDGNVQPILEAFSEWVSAHRPMEKSEEKEVLPPVFP